MKIHYKFRLIVFFSACVTLFSLSGLVQAANTDTIAFIAHGLTLNARHQAITASPQIILNTQNELLANLAKQATREQVDLLGRQQAAVAAKGKPAEGDLVWTNALMIDSFLGNSNSKEAIALRRLNIALLTNYGVLAGQPIAVEDLVKNTAPKFITQNFQLPQGPGQGQGPGINFHLQQIINDAKSYNQQCQAAGVPVPPAFELVDPTPDPKNPALSDLGGKIPVFKSPWVHEGQLTPNHSYLNPVANNPNQFSMVYSYTSANPQGFCLALPIVSDTTVLPIKDPNNPIPQGAWNAFGIICQSVTPAGNTDLTTSQSKACFWDNNLNIKFPAKGGTLALDSGNFIAPPDLPANNICTDCHAGENAFNIHPSTAVPKFDSPLQIAKNNFNNANPANNFTTRNNWYKPFVDADWPQNPEPQITNPQNNNPNSPISILLASYPNGNNLCSGCHNANDAGRLPDVAEGAFAATSGVAGGWPARDNHYKYCNFMLPNVLTSDATNGAIKGTMSSHVGINNGADLAKLYSKCSSLFPPLAGSQNAWILKHVLPPQ